MYYIPNKLLALCFLSLFLEILKILDAKKNESE